MAGREKIPLKWDRLSDELLDELIRQVEKRPTLYDTNHPDYGRVPARDFCWDSICEEILGLTGKKIERDLLKTRWRNLRDAYIKLYRKKEAGMSLDLVKKKVDFMNMMKFLIPYISKRRMPNAASAKTRSSIKKEILETLPVHHLETEEDSYDYDDTSNNYETGNVCEDSEKEMIQTIPDIIGYNENDEDDEEVDYNNDETLIIPEDNNDILTYFNIVNMQALKDKNEKVFVKGKHQTKTFQSSQHQEANVGNDELRSAAESVMKLNENDLFFLSMAKILNQLPVNKQIDVRRQVHAIVSAAQLQMLRD
ncbi:hypothetical protein WDU94_001374 [Cyamophila willieti]